MRPSFLPLYTSLETVGGREEDGGQKDGGRVGRENRDRKKRRDDIKQ